MARADRIRFTVFIFSLLEASDQSANKQLCWGRRSRTVPAAAGRVEPLAGGGDDGGSSARVGQLRELRRAPCPPLLGRRETPPQREALPHYDAGAISE